MGTRQYHMVSRELSTVRDAMPMLLGRMSLPAADATWTIEFCSQVRSDYLKDKIRFLGVRGLCRCYAGIAFYWGGRLLLSPWVGKLMHMEPYYWEWIGHLRAYGDPYELEGSFGLREAASRICSDSLWRNRLDRPIEIVTRGAVVCRGDTFIGPRPPEFCAEGQRCVSVEKPAKVAAPTAARARVSRATAVVASAATDRIVPPTVHITAELAANLLGFDAPNTPSPWSEFRIIVDDSLCGIDLVNCHLVDGVLQLRPEPPSVTSADARRIAAGVCWAVNTAPASKTNAATPGRIQTTIWLAGDSSERSRPICIYLRGHDRERLLTREHRRRRLLLSKRKPSLVRGHYCWQPCGPGWRDRKRIFRPPHYSPSLGTDGPPQVYRVIGDRVEKGIE